MQGSFASARCYSVRPVFLSFQQIWPIHLSSRAIAHPSWQRAAAPADRMNARRAETAAARARREEPRAALDRINKGARRDAAAGASGKREGRREEISETFQRLRRLMKES